MISTIILILLMCCYLAVTIRNSASLTVQTEIISNHLIAITANVFSDDISAALAAGMDAHVGKPLDVKQLCKTLTDCIRRING